tara:strand:- start:5078 stop:6607 length:1530 start_codon:yes stop_codon:yes gene_type:complete
MGFSDRLHHIKFWPPFLLLSITIGYSLYHEEAFMDIIQSLNAWILAHFSWLFSWSALLILLVLGIIYFSPVAEIRIGGRDAKPLLSKWRWFSITICTTIATGILFWGTAEPLMHLNQPPANLEIQAGSFQARDFAMSAMFMHWTLTPYGMYTITGLVFAICYYNLKQPFQVGSLVYPLFGKHAHGKVGTIADIICLYCLIAGMSASLGAGILTISGGLNNLFSFENNRFVLAIVGMLIVATFMVSAASGLMKGIRVLSDFNVRIFFLIAAIFLFFGPVTDLLLIAVNGAYEYAIEFLPRSVNWDNNPGESWFQSWTVFNWANWLAWTPITALFLGRLSIGYTVKQYIQVNLLLPAVFGAIWMTIFSGSALHWDMQTSGELFELMQAKGPESVVYALIKKLPTELVIGTLFLITTFISYVTAADSNTSAMSNICTKGVTPEHPESPVFIKIIWGTIIGLIAWIMIASAGIEGIKIISVLGGFPALLIVVLVVLGAVKLLIVSPDLDKLGK